jgi:hypothetical protein
MYFIQVNLEWLIQQQIPNVGKSCGAMEELIVVLLAYYV